VVVSARQLERWRARGLLAPNVRRWPGRGRGSVSEPPPGAGELVVWLARNTRPGRRPDDLALLAFAAGLSVPETTVRAAFAAAASDIGLPVEATLPPGTPLEDAAEAAVAARTRFTLVPARIRRIDHALAQGGVDWAAPAFAGLDPGLGQDNSTSSDWVFTTMQLVRGGSEGINMATVGALARTLAPAGGAAPIAGQVEYRWPISRGEEPAGLADDDELLALLGPGDLRNTLRGLAMTAPAPELREAFQLAADLPGWADGVCAAVEQEIAAGQIGPAIQEWVMGASGVPRLLLASSLRDPGAGPTVTAATALALLLVRTMIRALRPLLPPESFEVIKNPIAAPAILTSFLER
jgi:hypothetical protein